MTKYKHTYIYSGPVTRFGVVIRDQWSGETEAVSEKQAHNNLAYRFKKQFNYGQNTPISLPGKFIIVH